MILPLFVDVVMMLVAVRLTGSEKIRGFAPVTVMFAPIWINPALVKTRFVSGTLLPTASENAIVPVPAARDKISAPSMLEELPNVIFPSPTLVLIPTEAVKVMAFVKETDARPDAPFVVSIAAPKETSPPPVCETAPLDVTVFERVKRPVLSKVTGPEFVVTRAPVISKMVPVKEIPVDVLVVRVPAIVVVPLPAV